MSADCKEENRLAILPDGTVDKGTVFEFIDKDYEEIGEKVRKEKKHV